ncbi:hypothetical protein T484DRAFT_1743940 [Baffinella frigidus]|nr:hypothetical protein T484DRAFT_1743940 [Cryptophyta sp. CCMP2293]
MPRALSALLAIGALLGLSPASAFRPPVALRAITPALSLSRAPPVPPARGAGFPPAGPLMAATGPPKAAKVGAPLMAKLETGGQVLSLAEIAEVSSVLQANVVAFWESKTDEDRESVDFLVDALVYRGSAWNRKNRELFARHVPSTSCHLPQNHVPEIRGGEFLR